MAGEVIVDALPYIDQGYDEPGIREAVSICKASDWIIVLILIIILFINRQSVWLRTKNVVTDRQKIILNI